QRRRSLQTPLPRPLPSQPPNDRSPPRGPPRRAAAPRRAVRGGQCRVGAVSRSPLVAAPRQNRYHAAPPDGGGGVLDPHASLRRHRGGSSDHYDGGGFCGRTGRRRGAGVGGAARKQRGGGRRDHPPAARRRTFRPLRIKPRAHPAAVRVGRRDTAAGRRTRSMAEASRLTAEAPLPLTIAIVTWNSERWIERCLRSIDAACNGVAHEIVVYDNASTDRTPQLVRDPSAPLRATLLRGANNAGFAAGINR